MKRNKRPWTVREKLLILAPLLMGLAAGAPWLWRKMAPVSIDLEDGAWVRSMKFSPDGERMLVYFQDSKSNLSPVWVYDVASGAKTCELATPPATPSAKPVPKVRRTNYLGPSWSPDGNRIVSSYDDGSRGSVKIPSISPAGKNGPTFYYNSIIKIAVWDAWSGRVQINVPYAPPTENSYGGVYFSPDGQKLIGVGTAPSIFDAATGGRTQVFKSSLEPIDDSRLDLKQRFWALRSGRDTRFQVVEASTKRVMWEPQAKEFYDFRWTDHVLAVDCRVPAKKGEGQGVRSILLWDGATCTALPSIVLAPGADVGRFSLNGNHRTLAFFEAFFKEPPKNSPNQRLRVKGHIIAWDYRANRELWRAPLTERLYLLQWSPDGKWLAALHGGAQNAPSRLLVFDRSGQLKVEREVSESSTSFAWAPDSSRIAFITEAGLGKLRINSVRL